MNRWGGLNFGSLGFFMIRMSPTHTEEPTKTSLLIGDNFDHSNHVTMKEWFYLIPKVLMLAAKHSSVV